MSFVHLWEKMKNKNVFIPTSIHIHICIYVCVMLFVFYYLDQTVGCIQMHTPTHSRDCGVVDLICKQIIKLIARCISIGLLSPCGFVSPDLSSQLLVSKTHVPPVMTQSPALADATFHLISSQVQSGFSVNWGAPLGESKRSSPVYVLFLCLAYPWLHFKNRVTCVGLIVVIWSSPAQEGLESVGSGRNSQVWAEI